MSQALACVLMARARRLSERPTGAFLPPQLTSASLRHVETRPCRAESRYRHISGTKACPRRGYLRALLTHSDPSLGLWASLQRIWMSVYGHQHSTRGKKTITHGGRGSDLHAAESALYPFHPFLSFSHHLCSLKLKRWTSWACRCD